MNEIVKYNNDFNKLAFPRFTEYEHNLLMRVMFELKEKEGKSVKITFKEFKEVLGPEYVSSVKIIDYLKSLGSKFFKADFTICWKNEKEQIWGEERVNLFSSFTITYNKNNSIKNNQFLYLEIKINPDFKYLIADLTSNFTRFELQEFVSISGQYNKILYRLLKQFRSTGRLYKKFDEFKKILDIPATYKMCDIEKQILKPAIKELSRERNLFDEIRIPFKNLNYKKYNIRNYPVSRGEKVDSIEFFFEPLRQKI